jgi:hypothetical protein
MDIFGKWVNGIKKWWLVKKGRMQFAPTYDSTSNVRQSISFHKSFLGFIMGVCGMPSSRYSSPDL